jgi:hypothetical protein
MNRMLRRLDALESKLWDILVCLALLVLVNIGITITTWLLPKLSQQKTEGTSLRRETSVHQKFELMQKVLPCGLGNTLVDILEISRPVRMFRVTFPGVPPPEALLVFWSFGADQCASSEGFLVTFTPGGVEVICCDYSYLSEYVLFGNSHFSNGRQSIQGRRRRAPGEIQASVAAFAETPRLPVSAKNGSTAERDERVSIIVYLRRWIRHNLMMTIPPSEGILVALNPTDEGRIGTGRNTWKTGDERV